MNEKKVHVGKIEQDKTKNGVFCLMGDSTNADNSQYYDYSQKTRNSHSNNADNSNSYSLTNNYNNNNDDNTNNNTNNGMEGAPNGIRNYHHMRMNSNFMHQNLNTYYTSSENTALNGNLNGNSNGIFGSSSCGNFGIGFGFGFPKFKFGDLDNNKLMSNDMIDNDMIDTKLVINC